MKKTIALLTAILILVSSSFALEKRGKTSFSISYAHEFDNKAAAKNSETTYSHGVRLQVANEGFINMNAIVTVLLPYSSNISYPKSYEMKPIDGKQPFKITLVAGPSINLPITDFLTAYSTVGLKASFEIVKTTTPKETRKDLMTGLGIGGSFGFKVFSNKPINMILGADLYTDFYRAGTVLQGNIPNVSVACSPFVGVGFSL